MTKLSNPERKINLLIAVAGLHIGGAEVVIKNLVRHIDRKLFNVTVVCIKAYGSIGEELLRDGYDIISLNTLDQPKVDYFTFFKIMKIIRQKKIDIVHTHTNDALADAVVCKILMPHLKLIHTFHFGNYLNQRWRQMWIEQLFSRVASRLIAVGEVQRSQIKKVLHLRDKRISKVWNGIPTNKNEGDNSFRKRSGIGNRILIGTICTLIEQKGLFDLLSVAAQFRNDENNVRFVIIGDGPLRSELEKQQHEWGLENLVIFTGWLSDAAKTVLPVLDIFFQPSLWEAMSIVILEAMAAGKPIVATNVGENSEIIEKEVEGLIVEPKDTKGMVLALRRLIDDSELRNSLGNAAKQKATSQFTVEHMTREYEDIYREEFEKRWFRNLRKSRKVFTINDPPKK